MTRSRREHENESAPVDDTAVPLIRPGDVLARRYRLQRPLPAPAGAASVLWQAHDEVLARPVAVKLLPARDRRASAFLEAATRVGVVQARPLTRVYDAAVEPRSSRPSLAYVIREWVEGRDLTALLADGPLEPAEAVDLAVQGAEALVELHAAGAVHGALHPGNALVTADGRLRLTDTGVAAALHDGSPGPADDVRALGALLYALLTARWPGDTLDQPARGLSWAPSSEHGVFSPRQVRAGLSRALDALVVGTLHPGRPGGPAPLTDAPALLAALEAVARDVHRDAPPGAPRDPGRLRRSAPWAAVGAVLLLVGIVAYSLGLSVGEVPPVDDGLSATPSATAPVAPGAPGPIDLTGVPVRDFDPYGRPPQEQPDQVVNAHDGEPSTAWATDLYRTDRFGGLKPGVGLLVDLSVPTALSEVDVDLTRAGAELQLRAADAVGTDESSLPVVARDASGQRVARLAVPAGTTARYWLVWITRLPPDSGQFRAGIKELRFVRG